MSRRRDPVRRRKSQTQEERLASLRWNIKDAAEALKNAVDLGNWAAVTKYAKQIQALEEKLFLSSQIRARRKYDPRLPGWTNKLGMRMTAAEMEASDRQRRKGYKGVP